MVRKPTILALVPSAISSGIKATVALTWRLKSCPLPIMGLNFFRSLGAAGVVATVATVFSACQLPTQIKLEIRTDIDCKDMPSTAIIVGSSADEAESQTPGTITEMCRADGQNFRVGAIVLLPKSATNERIFVRVVMGVGQNVDASVCLDDPAVKVTDANGKTTGGCIVARRSLNFIPTTPLFLPVMMRGGCIGVPCDKNTTCALNNKCESAVVNQSSCSDDEGCQPKDPGMGGAGGMGVSSSSSSSSSSGTGGMGTGGMGTGGMGTGGMGTGGMGTGGMGIGGMGIGGMGIGGMGGSSSGNMGGAGGDNALDAGMLPDKDGGKPMTTGAGGMGTGGMGTGGIGTGGMGGSSGNSSSGGMGGTGGMGQGGFMMPPIKDGGAVVLDGGDGVVDGGDGVADGGVGTAGAGGFGGTAGAGGSSSGGFRQPYEEEDGLIPPGILIPGQSHALPARRTKPRKAPAKKTIPALRLPLYTYPRNVKP